jgi:predicted anti-sigma-YlaC factor YlaD
MRCEQARQALADARYEGERSPELHAHVAECPACAALEKREATLDRWLALSEPSSAGPGFDTRFFARLAADKARARRRRLARFAWPLLPLAAAAAFMFLRAPARLHAPLGPTAEVPPPADLGLAMELDLVEQMDVVGKLDEIEAYEVLSQVDDHELERIAQEVK